MPTLLSRLLHEFHPPSRVPRPSAGQRRVRLFATLLGAAIVMGGSPALALADDTPVAGPTPIAGTVTFFGRGYGHGIGLSQYGARGRALAGQDAATILAHYYAGTTLGTIDPATPVRVLIRSGFRPTTTNPARVFGRGGPWTIDGLPDVFPADGWIDLSRSSLGWQVAVGAPDGSILMTLPLAGIRVRPAAPETRFQVPFKSAVYNTYRGAIRLIGGISAVTAINEIGMDEYLLGVVPMEMPATWPIEAIRAQTIAARTYAAKRLRPSFGTWDVYDDTRSQLYRGVLAEKPAASQAILGTAGQVVMIGATLANTPFHATGGGATENNENVYVRWDGTIVVKPVAELRGSDDRAPDGTPFDALSPAATWQTATYSVDQLSAFMAADARTSVGTITALDLSNRGVSGRLISITLYGTTGTKTVSANLFRAIFNAQRPPGHPTLRSTLFALAPIP